MKKVYLVWSGVVGTSKDDYLDEVFTNKREAEKYVKLQNEYWKEISRMGTVKHWIHWIQEKQVRAEAILRGSQE